MTRIDDYYEPWTYDYENLIKSPQKKHQPVARPISQLTGEYIDLKWGPNWEDDLAGVYDTGKKDPNMHNVDEQVIQEYEQAFMMYLPRICEHCINPSCLSSCPSGAIYKRDEDGIVLVDEDACRSWRFCMSGCPYKKFILTGRRIKPKSVRFVFRVLKTASQQFVLRLASAACVTSASSYMTRTR